MLGAVFRQELLIAGRQDRLHQFRWAWAGFLMFQVLSYLPSIYVATTIRQAGRSLSPAGADQAFQILAWEQFVVLALLAPLFTAGAITDEKTKGTLLPLLATHLTPGQIVLEKFAARLAQLFLLTLAGVPLLAAAGGLAERPVLSLAALVAGTFGPIVALAAAGLLASVWCRTTSEAVLSTYLLVALLLFVVPSLPALQPLDPFPFVGLSGGSLPESDPIRELLRHLGWFALGWGGIAAGCLLIAAWRLRPAYFRQLVARVGRRQTQRPVVGDDPFYWKERYADGLLPFPMLRWVPRWLTWLGAGLGCAAFLGWGLWERLTARASAQEVLLLLSQGDLARLRVLLGWGMPSPNDLLLTTGFGVFGLVAVLANVRAASAFASERERQTWDSLLMVPLDSDDIVMGKMHGILASCWRCLIAASIPLLAVAALANAETFLSVVAVLVLAVPFCHLMAALGLSQSLRFQTTTTAVVVSLLLGMVYAFGTAVVLPCCCVCQFGVFRATGGFEGQLSERLQVLVLVTLIGIVGLVVVAVMLRSLAEECEKAAVRRLDADRAIRARPPEH